MDLSKDLAELIILQAIEDIWMPGRKRESMEFFNGDGFIDCADILGLSLHERQKVLEFVRIACDATARVPRPNPGHFRVFYGFSPQQRQLQN
ncbi:MAG: hypothetical protein P8013_00675 [Candidatus Sulfobium sp.]